MGYRIVIQLRGEQNTMVDKKFIADKIKEFRKKAGLTQTELAQKIGIGEKQISKIENYTNLPSLTTFFKIIDYLKIDISEFKINTIPLVNKNRLELEKFIYSSTEDELEFLVGVVKNLKKYMNNKKIQLAIYSILNKFIK